MLRDKRRIVLSTLGSLGDLHPIMGLALGLQARGHEVRVATSEFYRDRVTAAGLAFSVLRPLASPDDPQILRHVLHPLKGPQFLLRTLLLPHLADMYEDLLRATADADFLISGEVVMAASLVAEKRHIPWAGVILAPFSFFSTYDPPVFALPLRRAPAAVQRLILGVIKRSTRDWGRPIQELRSMLGLRPTRDPIVRDRFSPTLNLALFDRILGAPQADWPANTVQCGFVFHDAPAAAAAGAERQALAHFLAAGPPPIIFTLGSTAVLDPGRFFEESASAARLIQRRAVLLMGGNPQPVAGSETLFATDYAPYSQVFSGSAAVVHQGGVGTTAQALRAGVPQLVMPYAFDQPDNAARITRQGLGLSIARRHYRAHRTATLLQQLLAQPAISVRARQVAQRLVETNAVNEACEAIERVLAGEVQPAPPGIQSASRSVAS